MRPTTILLVDDHPILRQGLRTLLEQSGEFQVVGEAGDGRAGVQLAAELTPDVVLMDVSMPELNGLEATRQIASSCNQTHVLALSMHSDPRFVRGILQAGARGYILKDSLFEELERAIRRVAAGGVFLGSGVQGTILEEYLQGLEKAVPAHHPLTPREVEVLQLLAEGRSTRQIAARLHISGKTVETHRKRIKEKLGLQSVAELTKYAVREGLTTLEE